MPEQRLPGAQAWHLDRPVELDRALLAIMQEVTGQLGADRCTLFLVDQARQELVSRVGILPELAEIRLRLGEGVAGAVAASGRSLRVPDGEQDPRVLRSVDRRTGYQTRTLLAVPVRIGGHVVAVIELLNKREGAFDAADQARAEALAEQVSGLLAATSLASQLHPGQRQPLSFRYNHVVGESAAMQVAYDRVARAARAEVNVLLRGESGTGKELAARAIHENSPRAGGPFVKVDCAALPESLIENELFGHERGAYTGAVGSSEGRVAQAAGGTLFLDEIGELPLPVQGKLLRLIQERAWLRVGGTREQRADLRFVFATHRDLEVAVAQGRFRQDLYYRIRVVEIRLPPLRERGGGDLDRLIDHFLFTFGRQHRRPAVTLTPEARVRLHAHPWPGNVRELQNCLEAAVVMAPSDRVGPADLAVLPGDSAPPGDDDPSAFRCSIVPLREMERRYVEHVLRLNQGNRSLTARVLGIGRNTLGRKLSSEGEEP